MIPTQRQALNITLTRPHRDTTIVHLTGDLDDRSVPGLEELLIHRLRSCLRTVVVDLTELAYLSPRATDMLARQAGQARRNHTHLVIVACSPGRRVQADGGHARVLPCGDSTAHPHRAARS
ncbi:anti-anti-sigma factor [Saccharopolyspora erythraea NRRL 2338]|uniref:STAS domain-containing protein n=1 Tax=Saccharopolyspora erythraea TaxID=1836 RepID=UPI000310A0C1|nr:STAS domain-containing protein [Saccharopolyspora erythraea]PFG96632.1 anti-anti-sigma factor [Saccharopolyspora erythraea NRRL 2338]QRK93112.1 STAS domain-containing protein [Saccharopolyspora erythraea]